MTIRSPPRPLTESEIAHGHTAGCPAAETRIAELEAKLTAAIELINEYECQWGDDYLAKKWGLKEQAVAIRGELKR